MTAGPDRGRSHAVVAASSLAVLLAVLSSLLPPASAAAVAATAPVTERAGTPTAEEDLQPGLSASLTSLTPSTLRPGDPVEMNGRVVNTDTEEWQNVNVYLVISPSPLTTRDEVGATADSAPESYFGDRVTEFGRFDILGDLSPGEFAPFRVKVPWDLLPISGDDGVYTVGVHILATDVDGARVTAARARTFTPLAEAEDRAKVRLGLVWPISSPVLRRGDGTYARQAKLVRSMEPGGRLRRIVDLGQTAGEVPLTVVPDPAVLDAAQDIGSGDLGPPGGLVERVGAGPDGAAPEQNTGNGSEEESAGAGTGASSGVTAVQSWFDDALGLATAGTPWTTAYGEPSTTTLATSPFTGLSNSVDAATRGAQRRLFDRLARVLTLPVGGVVDPETLADLRWADGVGAAALAPRMLPGWDRLDGVGQQVATELGPLDVLVVDPALAGGGPTPGDPLSALQVRQRLLAETALLSAEGAAAGRRSVSAAFVAPPRWDPGADWPSTGFFSGLTVPWLRPVPVDDLLAQPRSYDGPTGAPGTDEVDEVLPEELTTAAAQLHRRARLLVQLVDGSLALRRWYDAGVALGVSRSADDDLLLRQQLTERAAASVRHILRGVTLTGPEFVTLSSTRGPFPLTITNELDRAVTVSVAVETAAGEEQARTRFETGSQLTIGPGQRETVTVDTRVGEVGVTTAEAYVVTESGRRVGTPLVFSLRTSVVGRVIWAIMGVACAVLVFAIGRRIWRRGRR